MKGAENDLDIVHEEITKRYEKENPPRSDAEEEEEEEEGGDGEE